MWLEKRIRITDKIVCPFHSSFSLLFHFFFWIMFRFASCAKRLSRSLSTTGKTTIPSIQGLSDAEIVKLVKEKRIPHYKLESVLNNTQKAAQIRREALLSNHDSELKDIPLNNWNSGEFFARVQIFPPLDTFENHGTILLLFSREETVKM